MIKVHDILKPQNNTFPLAETNDIQGTVKIYDNVAQMNAINPAYILPGTFCYIKDEDVYYKYYVGPRIFSFEMYGLNTTNFSLNDNINQAHLNQYITVVSGDKFIFSNSNYTYDIYSRSLGAIVTGLCNNQHIFNRTYTDIVIIAYLTDGSPVTNHLYEISKNVSLEGPSEIVKEWINVNFSNIHVGDLPPKHQDAVWIDTASSKNPAFPSPLTEQQQLLADVTMLKDVVNKLSLVVTAGARAGDSTIGNNPYATLADFNGLTENNIPYTLSNISIKYDTYARLNANKKNLINGEPVYATDTGILYIMFNNILLPLTGNNTFSAGNIMEDTNTISPKKLLRANISAEENEIKTNVANINKYIRIISAYSCKDINLDAAATHNFITLGNYSDNIIDLSGLFIIYKDNNKVFSEPLSGYIQPSSSYIIRGNRCSYSSNITMDIDEYDQDWNISFSDNAEFFIAYSANNLSKKVTPKGKAGYIDKFRTQGITNIFFKKHMLDKNYIDNDEATYINMSKINNPYYYTNEDVLRIKPGHVNNIESKLAALHPNCVNDTFGLHATANISNKASRYFTWVSVGCYDEYLFIQDSEGNERHVLSTSEKWVYDNNIVTTHRVYIDNLKEGTYTYFIKRDEDYVSKQYIFRIYSDDEIDQDPMTIGIVSDFINDNFTDIIKKKFLQDKINGHFTVNITGATTNDKISQWIDYVNASIYNDIPALNAKDSVDNLNKFYTFNKPLIINNKIIENVVGFIYGNYYIVIVGNDDLYSKEINEFINSINDKFTIIFTERKDITAGNAIFNHIDTQEYKIITSTYKENEYDVEDDIIVETTSIENYYTDGIFNENLI